VVAADFKYRKTQCQRLEPPILPKYSSVKKYTRVLLDEFLSGK